MKPSYLARTPWSYIPNPIAYASKTIADTKDSTIFGWDMHEFKYGEMASKDDENEAEGKIIMQGRIFEANLSLRSESNCLCQ